MLKPSCVDAGVSYEDRVARRKEEIASLEEALEIFNGKVEQRLNTRLGTRLDTRLGTRLDSRLDTRLDKHLWKHTGGHGPGHTPGQLTAKSMAAFAALKNACVGGSDPRRGFQRRSLRNACVGGNPLYP